MLELIPAILAKDEDTFRKRLALVENAFPVIQIDLMDGAFVPNRTWFDANVFKSISTPVKFELHIMAMDPGWYLDQLKSVTAIARVIWHIEININHSALIERCRNNGKENGLAIKPSTPINSLVPFVDRLDEILVMGAEPGLSGQKLQPSNVERVKEIRAHWPNIAIGFDIGVSKETIPTLREAGVTRFYSASAIFETAEPIVQAKEMSALLV